MITVIKHGKFQVYEKTCPECGCKFRFTTDDIKTMTFFVAPTPFIQCPDCKMICVVKEAREW